MEVLITESEGYPCYYLSIPYKFIKGNTEVNQELIDEYYRLRFLNMKMQRKLRKIYEKIEKEE